MDISVQAGRIRWQRWMVWAGRVVSVWPAFVVLTSARWKLTHAATYVAEFTRIGWSSSSLELLAVLQLSALGLYLIPQTAVLGAVLLTGYLGGAVAAYVRIGEYYPPLVPFSTAVIAWFGLFLRDDRIRALLPLRRRHTSGRTR
jgi:hypothetical protein